MTTTTTIRRVLTGVAAAAALWLSPGVVDQASAQSMKCGDHRMMISTLSKKFKESRQGIGLVSNHQMVELFVSEKGSWTVLFTRPNGLSCIGAVGRHWEQMPKMEMRTPGAQSKFMGDDPSPFPG